MIIDETTPPPANQDPAQQTLVEPEEAPVNEPNYKELYLRTNADFQNFRKRIERERTDLAHNFQADAIERLLPVIDDLDRAITAAQQSGVQEAWLDGFVLILKNAKKKLAELGVEEVANTTVFDPTIHEALMHVESANHNSGDIVQVLEKGYALKGKVIKYARVSVAK